MHLARRDGWILLAILACGFIARLFFSPLPGHESDMLINEGWMRSAAEFGVVQSYHRQLGIIMRPNHGPVEIALYAGAERLYQLFISSAEEFVQPAHRIFAKLPAIVFELLTCALLFFLFRALRGPNAGLVAAGVYAFHAAVIYDSAVWGQTDGIYTALVVATVFAFAKQAPVFAGIVYVLACLHKPQAAIFLPLFLLVSARDWHFFLRTLGSGIVTLFLCLLPFALQGTLQPVLDVYLRAHEHAQGRLSLNAFNLWWALFGEKTWQPISHTFLDLVSYSVIGIVFFALSYLATLVLLQRRLRFASTSAMGIETLLFAATLIACAFFLFSPGMHERYLYPVMALGLVLLWYGRSGIVVYALLSLSFLLNLHLVLTRQLNDGFNAPMFPMLSVSLAALNVFLFVYAWSFLKEFHYEHKYTKNAKRSRSESVR